MCPEAPLKAGGTEGQGGRGGGREGGGDGIQRSLRVLLAVRTEHDTIIQIWVNTNSISVTGNSPGRILAGILSGRTQSGQTRSGRTRSDDDVGLSLCPLGDRRGDDNQLTSSSTSVELKFIFKLCSTRRHRTTVKILH